MSKEITINTPRCVKYLSRDWDLSPVEPYKTFNIIVYDGITHCRSAGVIPYTFKDGQFYFLLQRYTEPLKRKDCGWNDFGGKRLNDQETSMEIAAREFSEETSCLFYLYETGQTGIYELLKDRPDLKYPDEAVQVLLKILPESQKYFMHKIKQYVMPIYINMRDIYISYFIRVPYLPETDIPRCEDLHIDYQERFLRTCKWFNYEELMGLNDQEFHKRLQVSQIKKRVSNFYQRGIFE